MPTVRIEVLHDGYRAGRDVDLDAATDAELGSVVRHATAACLRGRARTISEMDNLMARWANAGRYYSWRDW